eukprot:2801973-Alexandrium_andersonii.AAC.1
MSASLVGSEMCIRDSPRTLRSPGLPRGTSIKAWPGAGTASRRRRSGLAYGRTPWHLARSPPPAARAWADARAPIPAAERLQVECGEEPCRLCGLGDASSEHLLVGCPVVHLAWARLAPAPARPLLDATRSPGPEAEEVVNLLHQVSYWALALPSVVTSTASQMAERLAHEARWR